MDNIKVKITFYFANLTEDQSPHVSAIKDIVARLTGAVKKAPSKKLLEFFDDEIERLKSMDRLGYASVHAMTKSRFGLFSGLRYKIPSGASPVENNCKNFGLKGLLRSYTATISARSN